MNDIEIFERFIRIDWNTYRTYLKRGYKPSELKLEVEQMRHWIKRVRQLKKTKKGLYGILRKRSLVGRR